MWSPQNQNGPNTVLVSVQEKKRDLSQVKIPSNILECLKTFLTA
jgi:hypothetical protein